MIGIVIMLVAAVVRIKALPLYDQFLLTVISIMSNICRGSNLGLDRNTDCARALSIQAAQCVHATFKQEK